MRKIILLVTLCLSLSACFEKQESDIHVKKAYGFATMPGARTGAAFMILKNKGAEDDALIAVQSNLAEITEIHENALDSHTGTMMMRKINRLDLPVGQNVTLEPTGHHIMFINLKDTMAIGQPVPVKLTFEKSESVTVNVEIIAPGTKP